MDATFVESQPLHIMNMNTEDIAKKYLFTETQDWDTIITKDIIVKCLKIKIIKK